jgi:hypothetical protein
VAALPDMAGKLQGTASAGSETAAHVAEVASDCETLTTVTCLSAGPRHVLQPRSIGRVVDNGPVCYAVHSAHLPKGG